MIPDLDEKQIAAGKEFLAITDKIGLRSQTLAWFYDISEERMGLLFASSYFDAIGPLKMNKLLHRAYRASILPKEVDPFALALASPKNLIVQEITESIRIMTEGFIWHSEDSDAEFPESLQLSNDRFVVFYDGVYRVNGNVRSNINFVRGWRNIERTIDGLIAA